jgi:hypothetical protein
VAYPILPIHGQTRFYRASLTACQMASNVEAFAGEGTDFGNLLKILIPV